MKRLIIFFLLLVVLSGAGAAYHYSKRREVDDWRHIHTWDKWAPALPVNGNLWQTRKCQVCGKFVARKVME